MKTLKNKVNRWRTRRLHRLARLLNVQVGTTPGVDLKLTVNSDVLVDADSDFLYWLAIWGGFRDSGDGWIDLTAAGVLPGLDYSSHARYPLLPGAVQVFIRPRPKGSRHV